MKKEFSILAINISDRKGIQKKPVKHAVLVEDFGIEGDAHAGKWHRQVSLLGDEDIDSMREKGIDLGYGDFAENITTRGINLSGLPVGTRIFMDDAVLEITQIGKKCHHGCEISRIAGTCVMPEKGVFARVLKGGSITAGSRCFYENRGE